MKKELSPCTKAELTRTCMEALLSNNKTSVLNSLSSNRGIVIIENSTQLLNNFQMNIYGPKER